TSGYDGRVLRWDLATGGPLETITLRPARLPGQPLITPVVNLSADATRACWTTRDPVEVFDVETAGDLFCIPAGPPSVTGITLSPDGMKLIALTRPAAGKQVGTCTVWDLAAERREAELEVPYAATGPVGMAALSPDGDRL